MLKYILVGVAIFLVAVVAFYGGLIIGRGKPDPPPGVPRPPSEDHWIYPDAMNMMRSGSKDGFLAVLTTPDDFDSVARFYHQEISASLGLHDDDYDPRANGITATGLGSGQYVRASDSLLRDGVGPRKVRIQTFEVRSRSYDLTVFVNRADGDKHTHILLTYDPKPPQ